MDSRPTNSERIEEVAAGWFWKRDSGLWTEDDQAQFDAWIRSATAHRVAYLRLKAGWKRAARMKALGAGVPAGVIPPPRSWGDTRFSRGTAPGNAVQPPVPEPVPVPAPKASDSPVNHTSKRRHWAIAATIALTAITGLYAYRAGPLHGTRYSTPVGGLDTVPLADGSQVILNTDTRIRVDLTSRERRIELDKGEAFFDVAKDPARPFFVQVDNKRVTAVGTKFSVRREGGDIRVTVTEGKVRIDQPAHSSPLLTAGSVARTSNTETLVREGSAPEAEQMLSWRSGYLVFEATPLAEAVAEFNRYNARKIVIDDPATAALRIGGNFRANNTDAFLWLLQSGFPVNVRRHGERIVLTKK